MREKRESSSQDSNRRDPRAVHYYDERMPRHKSKVVVPRDERDGDSSQPRYRSTTSRPHDKEKERDSVTYYRSRSGHLTKLMSLEEAQKAIRTLFVLVKEAKAFFAIFKEEYQQNVRGIRAYAGQTILEKLWERRIRHSDSKNYPSKARSKDDDVGLRSAFSGVSNRFWDGLNDAYEGARSHPSSQNESLARKLDMAIKEFGGLLVSARTSSQKIDDLINELELLEKLLELGGAGKVSQDDRANRQLKARGVGHRHLRDSSPEREDAQYGGTGEGSDSEDNGQEDEQHGAHSGEKEESEAGGDEEVGGGGDGWGN